MNLFPSPHPPPPPLPLYIGPLPHTVVDFWRLVWQERPLSIVMLCKVVECHRVKCQQYWPTTDAKTYGPISVRKLSQETFVDHVIRKFELTVSWTD